MFVTLKLMLKTICLLLSIKTEDPDDVIAPPAPPAIPNFGAPSPQKMHGSFLHRLDDAKKLLAASSPVKGQMSSPGRGRRIQTYSPGSAKRKQFASPMAMDAAKRRLHVDEDKNTVSDRLIFRRNEGFIIVIMLVY